MKQTKPRTDEIIPNDNICFSIDTILAVKNQITIGVGELTEPIRRNSNCND